MCTGWAAHPPQLAQASMSRDVSGARLHFLVNAVRIGYKESRLTIHSPRGGAGEVSPTPAMHPSALS